MTTTPRCHLRGYGLTTIITTTITMLGTSINWDMYSETPLYRHIPMQGGAGEQALNETVDVWEDPETVDSTSFAKRQTFELSFENP